VKDLLFISSLVLIISCQKKSQPSIVERYIDYRKESAEDCIKTEKGLGRQCELTIVKPDLSSGQSLKCLLAYDSYSYGAHTGTASVLWLENSKDMKFIGEVVFAGEPIFKQDENGCHFFHEGPTLPDENGVMTFEYTESVADQNGVRVVIKKSFIQDDPAQVEELSKLREVMTAVKTIKKTCVLGEKESQCTID
jgi:hypothetical protein